MQFTVCDELSCTKFTAIEDGVNFGRSLGVKIFADLQVLSSFMKFIRKVEERILQQVFHLSLHLKQMMSRQDSICQTYTEAIMLSNSL